MLKILLFIICCTQVPHLSALDFLALKTPPKKSSYDPQCMCCTLSKDDAGTVAFTKHWKIVLTENQSYLGRVVIVSQRHFGSYEEMTDDEAQEYREIFQKFLPALQKTFNATHFNVCYLMNGAYNEKKPEPAFKDGKPNPHFHWHILPRYDGKREFAQTTFEDPDFGNIFNLHRKQYVDEKFKKELIEAIQENLEITYVSS